MRVYVCPRAYVCTCLRECVFARVRELRPLCDTRSASLVGWATLDCAARRARRTCPKRSERTRFKGFVIGGPRNEELDPKGSQTR